MVKLSYNRKNLKPNFILNEKKLKNKNINLSQNEKLRNNWLEKNYYDKFIKDFLIINRKTIIYHYCSMDAFLSIINSGKLWLSSTDKMNDVQEGKNIKDCFSWFSEEIKNVDQIISEFEVFDDRMFITCFSKSGDKLSQWRAYAEDGKGVAIGLNVTSLNVAFGMPNVHRMKDNKNSVGVFPVVYDNKIKKKVFDYFINRHVELINNNNAASYDILKKLSCVFKNENFSEEEEWRLIYYPFFPRVDGVLENEFITDNSRLICNIEFRNSNRGVCAYFPFEFNRKSLVKIILGPQNQSHEFDIKHLLKCNNYDPSSVSVIKSKIPYLNLA